MFLVIVYVLSNQPMDLTRFAWFTAIGLATGLTSQGFGYIIGSIFNITVGILGKNLILLRELTRANKVVKKLMQCDMNGIERDGNIYWKPI